MKAKKTKNTDSSLKKATKKADGVVEKSHKKPTKKSSKIMFACGFLGLAGGIGLGVAAFLLPTKTAPGVVFPEIPSKTDSTDIYSNLTGLPLASEADVTAPAYCIQTPNGTDGARPQAGLNQAGVIFEAIAESGITRFAAIYQNPTSAIIGPIRSLRIYYLKWDTPFDCTIVHAGGAPDALAAVANGYKDLTEDYSYMYRGTYGSRLWNNLFTTSSYLKKMSSDRGYNTSNIKGFSRMTPDESARARVDSLVEEKLDIVKPSTGKTSTLKPAVDRIAVNFGGWATFNVRYKYDSSRNVYLREYETGAAHNVYECPEKDMGEKNPEDICTLTQLAPSVVAVIKVSERRASDNYHEDITAIGSGDAVIFQNGTAVEGNWRKESDADQIKFYDKSGTEIKLAPGQTFVEAVPNYGSIDY